MRLYGPTIDGAVPTLLAEYPMRRVDDPAAPFVTYAVDPVAMNRISDTVFSGPFHTAAHAGLLAALMSGDSGYVRIFGDDYYGEGALGLVGSQAALGKVARVCRIGGQP